MKVHSIIWLFGNSCYVSHPKGSDDQDEESNKVEEAILNKVPFEFHLPIGLFDDTFYTVT